MSQVIIQKNNDKIDVKVWNRTYTIDKTPSVLSSIVSNGKQLLSSPISIYMESDGKKCTFKEGVCFKVNCGGADGKEDVVVKTFESECSVVNMTFEPCEDGMIKVSLSLMPRGRTVAQNFGLESPELAIFKPNKLYLEIPFSACCADYYHVFPIGAIKGIGEYENEYGLCYAGSISKNGFYSAFKEQVYISGQDCGLGIIVSDNRTWLNTDESKAVEFIKKENGEGILRFHLLDDTPKVWLDTSKMLDMPPISFDFALIATPVKQFPKDSFYERNLHIDCFKKIANDYDEFLAGEVVEGSGENGYDRIARLGVKVLYLHEKWNDLQNSPMLTDKTIERVKTIIAECHKRGIKVIPYFGYELSTLSPLFSKHGQEFWLKRETYPYSWYWYRYPYQRDINVCLGSKWSDILYEGLTRLYDELGFDGLYFDGTTTPNSCINTEHGCGYIDENGNVKPTYPVWEIREFMKRIYSFVKSRKGAINVHGSGACNMATLYYEDSMWEGELFQGLLMNGKLTKMPEGMMRAQFTGRDTGIPVYSLCYSNDPVWTFKSASAFSLLHGSLPKPVDIGSPLEQMSVIWDAFDKFPLDKAEWKPYWNQSDKIRISGVGIKVSVWETENEMLMVCASTSSDFCGKIHIDSCFQNVCDALCDNKTEAMNGSFDVELSGIDYKMYYLKQ